MGVTVPGSLLCRRRRSRGLGGGDGKAQASWAERSFRGDPCTKGVQRRGGGRGDWVFRAVLRCQGGKWICEETDHEFKCQWDGQAACASHRWIILTGLSACSTETKTGSQRRAQSHMQLAKRRRGCARIVPESKVEASRRRSLRNGPAWGKCRVTRNGVDREILRLTVLSRREVGQQPLRKGRTGL